jgi:hypothetical protein
MTIKNTLFNTDDLSHSISVRDSNEYETKFPHQDLWGKQDAILKWISVLERFQELYPENGVKVELLMSSLTFVLMLTFVDLVVCVLMVKHSSQRFLERLTVA